MTTIRRIRGRSVNLDEIAKELNVPKESLMKYNRPILQKWVKEHYEAS